MSNIRDALTQRTPRFCSPFGRVMVKGRLQTSRATVAGASGMEGSAKLFGCRHSSVPWSRAWSVAFPARNRSATVRASSAAIGLGGAPSRGVSMSEMPHSAAQEMVLAVWLIARASIPKRPRQPPRVRQHPLSCPRGQRRAHGDREGTATSPARRRGPGASLPAAVARSRRAAGRGRTRTRHPRRTAAPRTPPPPA